QTSLHFGFQGLSFCQIDDKTGRGIYDEEVKTSSRNGETFLGGPSGLKDVGRGNAPSSCGILLEEERIERTLASPIPSRPSGSNPTPKDKGKAYLIKDDDDEEEVPLQRNQRASAPLTPDVNPESALEDGRILISGLFRSVCGGGS
ncbi:unnamed protein product, partial [Prunus brigantina]